MSPLDAARRLALYAEQRPCPDCRGQDEAHAPSCPHLLLPKIVAALEAAERFVDMNERPDEFSVTDLMKAEDDLHEAFGYRRRYGDGDQQR